MTSSNFQAQTNPHSAFTVPAPMTIDATYKNRVMAEDTAFEELEQEIARINLDDVVMLTSRPASNYVMTPDHLKVPIKIPVPYNARPRLVTFTNESSTAPSAIQMTVLPNNGPSCSDSGVAMGKEFFNEEPTSTDEMENGLEFLNRMAANVEEETSTSNDMSALVAETLPSLSLHGVLCYHLNSL